jgi:hypothetical protein
MDHRKQQLSARCFYRIAAYCATKHTRKNKELMQLKAHQDESYLHPKETLITDFLLETVQFNQDNASKLGSGKKMSEELDEVFRGMILKK